MEDPRFFLSCLPAPGVVCVMETRTTACSLRISAGGAALAEEWVLGPLWLPPPFLLLPPTGTNDSTLNRQGSGDLGPFRGRYCAEMC